jgi:hypothetical protein
MVESFRGLTMTILDFVLLEIIGCVIPATFLTAIAVPTLKWTMPSLSWRECLWLSAKAIYLALGAFLIIILALGFVGMALGVAVRAQVIGNLGVIAIVGAAWLVSRTVQKAGYPQKFPGIGTRVFVAWLAASWLIAGLVFLTGSIKG